MEAVVLQAARRQLLRVRRLAGTAEGARRAEPGVVDQDDQDVGRALGRTQLLDRRELRVRILCIIGNQTGSLVLGIGRWERCFLSSLFIASALSEISRFVLNFPGAAFPVRKVGMPEERPPRNLAALP